VAIVPAILATILVFLDQQITAVIVNRSEHKLKVIYALHVFSLVSVSLEVDVSVKGPDRDAKNSDISNIFVTCDRRICAIRRSRSFLY